MKKYYISERAEQDMVEIVQYIAKDKPNAAEKFWDLLITQYEVLAANPKIGFIRAEIDTKARIFPYGNYLIMYREHKETVRISRVIHMARANKKLH